MRVQARTAFDLLLAIDQRCRAHAAGLPSQDAPARTWSGIGFRLAGQWLVAPMEDIAEVLREPQLSRLPGVKPWVLGMSNLRGRLLPIMDLCGLLDVEPSGARQRRVLVVEHAEVFAGLVVDEVLGLQHFPRESLEPAAPLQIRAAMAPFVQGHFQREQVWSIFSLQALVQSVEFRDVAL